MLYNKYYKIQKSMIIYGVIVIFLAMAFSVDASEMTYGEMQAAIRSANFPCANVIDLESSKENSWIVKCNSGKYRVTRDKNGKFTVNKTE